MRSQVQKGTVNPRYVRTSPVRVFDSPAFTRIVKSGMKRSDCGTRYV